MNLTNLEAYKGYGNEISEWLNVEFQFYYDSWGFIVYMMYMGWSNLVFDAQSFDMIIYIYIYEFWIRYTIVWYRIHVYVCDLHNLGQVF